MSAQDRMSDEVRAYLDGERGLETLSPAGLEEAAMWNRASEQLNRDTVGASAPEWLEGAVMAEIGSDSSATSSPVDPQVRSWWRRPLEVRVTPLTGLLVAAGLAALSLLPQDPAPPAQPGTVYVQFVLEAPGAQSVSVAGDFSEWQDMHTLDDADGDGVWSGRVPLRPGVHQYMFVIDGADWVTDPRADRYADDGFGNRNAVIAVESAPQAIS